MELFHEGYDMSFLANRPDIIELYLMSSPNAKMILLPLLESIGFHSPAPNNNSLSQIVNQNNLNNSNMQRRLEQEARGRMNQQAKAAQQEERRLAQQVRAAQQANRKAQQARQAQAKAAQQAERKAAQQAQRRANQEARKAAQQAKRRTNQAAKAAQEAAQKAAQQAARQAQQAKQNLPPAMIAPIINRGGGGFRLGPSRPNFSRGLRGSTSTTMSTRSHGGARFNNNDPRMLYRN
jgi:DNA polymerase III gamma/tau subunit